MRHRLAGPFFFSGGCLGLHLNGIVGGSMALTAAGIAPAGVSCRIGLYAPGTMTPDAVSPAIDLMRYHDGGFHEGRFRKI